MHINWFFAALFCLQQQIKCTFTCLSSFLLLREVDRWERESATRENHTALFSLFHPRVLTPFQDHVQTQVSAKHEKNLRVKPQGSLKRKNCTGDSSFSHSNMLFLYCLYLLTYFTLFYSEYVVIIITVIIMVFHRPNFFCARSDNASTGY